MARNDPRFDILRLTDEDVSALAASSEALAAFDRAFPSDAARRLYVEGTPFLSLELSRLPASRPSLQPQRLHHFVDTDLPVRHRFLRVRPRGYVIAGRSDMPYFNTVDAFFGVVRPNERGAVIVREYQLDAPSIVRDTRAGNYDTIRHIGILLRRAEEQRDGDKALTNALHLAAAVALRPDMHHSGDVVPVGRQQVLDDAGATLLARIIGSAVPVIS